MDEECLLDQEMEILMEMEESQRKDDPNLLFTGKPKAPNVPNIFSNKEGVPN
jgi:hypothetical protein